MFGNYLIRGTIITQNKIILDDVILYIKIVDSTLCDIPSKIIHSYILKNINKHMTDVNEINFNFYIKKELIKPNKDYSIHVHIDLDKDGKISNGDYINMENYPLTTLIESNNNIINVKQIK